MIMFGMNLGVVARCALEHANGTLTANDLSFALGVIIASVVCLIDRKCFRS